MGSSQGKEEPGAAETSTAVPSEEPAAAPAEAPVAPAKEEPAAAMSAEPAASDAAAPAEPAAPAAGEAAGEVAAEQRQLEEEERKLEEAMREKERGGELYKQQKLAEAREAWTAALGLMPPGSKSNLSRLTVSLHLNLAQVCLAEKDYEGVLKHASEALLLDEENSKAFYRRGLAKEALGELQAAALDLKKAARIEPRHAEIRKKYEELKQKAQAKQEEEEEKPVVHDLSKLPRAFLELQVGAGAPRRLVFALYSDSAPKTAENFRQLCTGEHAGLTARGKAFCYKGSLLHRMVPGLMVQGGDFENGNGTGGESIYGRRFADETFREKHTRRGLLAMANDGPNTNGSNFFVLFAAAEHLDRHHVIFGELLEGWDVLDELEKMEVDEESKPLTECRITACGALEATG